MNGYYESVFKIFILIGIDFRSEDVKFFYSALLINLFFSIFGGAQEVLFLLNPDNLLLEKFTSVPCVLLAFEALIKHVSVIYYSQRIKKIILELNKIYEMMEPSDQNNFKTESLKLRKISHNFFFCNYGLVIFFLVSPILAMAQVYLTTGVQVYLYPYFLWWPFDHLNYFVSTYFYIILSANFISFQATIFDVLFMMILAKVVAYYRYLSRSFVKLLEQLDGTNNDNKKLNAQLGSLVDLQQTLSHQCNEMNEIFGSVFLARVIFASLIICFGGFVIVTQEDLIIVVQFSGVVIITLVHMFVLCWFGHKIQEEVW